jgi:hypothetical protein
MSIVVSWRAWLWLAVAALAPGPGPQAQGRSAPAALAGEWEGEAEIVVSWTAQRTLAVRLVVDTAGHVHGRVGDAELVDGRLRPNRGAVLRALGWKSDHIVTGRLRGPILATEGVVREGVRIPFDVVGGCLVGGVHTTGAKAGGRERMMLSARHLVLRRAARPTLPRPC